MPLQKLQNQLISVNSFSVECQDHALTQKKNHNDGMFVGKGNVSVNLTKSKIEHLLLIDWHESGSWQRPYKIEFTNAYRWQLDLKNNTVSISHARFGWDKLVHLVELHYDSKNQYWDTITPHLCGSDNYHLSIYQLGNKHSTLKLHWRIVGENKDLDIINCYNLQ